jgi:hypothetical protein
MSDQHHTHICDPSDPTHIRPMTQTEREASKTREEANMPKKKKGKKYGK